jgi:hypothetical protein
VRGGGQSVAAGSRCVNVFAKRPQFVCADIDDRCLCLMLKAMCWRSLQSPYKAEQHLNEIISR